MEDDGGSGGHLRHQKIPPSSDRFLGIPRFQSSAPAPPLELSEHDIFNTPSGSSSPSSTNSGSSPSPNPHRGVNNQIRGHNGILAVLNDQNQKARSGSGSDTRPVFNHKASTSASLSSSSSTSPASSAALMIPKRPPPPPSVERTRFQPRSAPMKIPKMPAVRGRELEEIAWEGEGANGGVMLAPHELLDSRRSPRLACSVLEGAGRTLKGRDLRQVEAEPLLTPLLTTLPGRPKLHARNRSKNRSKDEVRKSSSQPMMPKNSEKLSRNGQKMKWKMCNQEDHNPRSCLNKSREGSRLDIPSASTSSKKNSMSKQYKFKALKRKLEEGQ